MKRFFRWLKALFNRGMDRLEDPDMMLDQARRDMQENYAQNKERAVQAITQKNKLQAMLEDAKKQSENLESKASMSLRQGNRDLARQLLREKMNNDSTVASLEGSYAQAVQTVESVKIAIKRQEEEVRKKMAEALAMKAQWKQAQIQNSINKALDGLTFENQFEGFGAAAERIRDAQSEAKARQEMAAESIQSKVMAMEDKAMDYEAEAELEKLEARLGMKATAAPAQEVPQVQQVSTSEATTPPAVPVDEAAAKAAQATETSEIDKQLAELENRVNNDSK